MDDVRKPLVIRMAPVLLLAHAAYTAAFVALMLEASSGSGTGVASGPLAPAALAGVLLLRVSVYLALAWGFWRAHSWARPTLVAENPAFVLLLLVLAPASSRIEALTSLPQAAILSLAFYGYLYWKPNVSQYWESNAVPSAQRL